MGSDKFLRPLPISFLLPQSFIQILPPLLSFNSFILNQSIFSPPPFSFSPSSTTYIMHLVILEHVREGTTAPCRSQSYILKFKPLLVFMLFCLRLLRGFALIFCKVGLPLCPLHWVLAMSHWECINLGTK